MHLMPREHIETDLSTSSYFVTLSLEYPKGPCLIVILALCRQLIFFSKSTFTKKKKNRKAIILPAVECQTTLSQIRSDVLSGLIWVQTVIGYQHTTPVGKEFMGHLEDILTLKAAITTAADDKF